MKLDTLFYFLTLFVVIISDTAKLSCDFDDGTVCQYNQSDDDTSDWLMTSNPREGDNDTSGKTKH